MRSFFFFLLGFALALVIGLAVTPAFAGDHPRAPEPNPPFIVAPESSPGDGYRDNYGITHGLIAGAAVGGVSLFTTDEVPLAITAVATCGWFVHRELQGPGNLFNSKGRSSDLDRVADWVVPCAVAGGIYYWRAGEATVFPWFTDDGVGVSYFTNF